MIKHITTWATAPVFTLAHVSQAQVVSPDKLLSTITCRLGHLALALAVVGILVAPASPAFAQADCQGVPATITIAAPGLVTNGTVGSDVIFGTPGNDTINGLAGDDRICGRGGNDTIHGDDGDDTLFGGPGDDTVFGDDDNDRVHGGDGVDSLTGGTGDDFFSCGPGADVANGTSGNETLGPNHMCEVVVNIP